MCNMQLQKDQRIKALQTFQKNLTSQHVKFA
jgi:hypothetical protein